MHNLVFLAAAYSAGQQNHHTMSAEMDHLTCCIFKLFHVHSGEMCMLRICVPLQVFCSVFYLQTEGPAPLLYLCVGMNYHLPCSFG